MKFIWRFYWILKRKVFLAKMNNHHGAGPQRRRAQCSCIGCIGLRPAVSTGMWCDNRCNLARWQHPHCQLVIELSFRYSTRYTLEWWYSLSLNYRMKLTEYLNYLEKKSKHWFHGCNLVGDTGDVSPHFFRWGEYNTPCPPTFSLQALHLEKFQK